MDPLPLAAGPQEPRISPAELLLRNFLRGTSSCPSPYLKPAVVVSQEDVMRAYLAKLTPAVRMLLVMPVVVIAYAVVMIVVPAIVYAIVPNVVRSVLSLI